MSRPSFLRYQQRLFKRLIREAFTFHWQTIGVGCAVVFIPAIVASRHLLDRSIDWVLVRTTLWIYLAIAVVYGAIQFFRSIWKLDLERVAEIECIQRVVESGEAHIEAKETEIRILQLARDSSTALQAQKDQDRQDSISWIELSREFDVLSTQVGHVTADWQTTKGSTIWTLRNDKCQSFCLLAGSMLLCSPTLVSWLPHAIVSNGENLERWLELLKYRRPSTTGGIVFSEDLEDGTKLTHYAGQLEVIKNSAILCRECASIINAGGTL
jgi:hypothetical protein